MKALQGTVSNIRFSTEVSGTENSTSTSQIGVFELDGQHVELKIPESIIISNGDSVVVAGKLERGLFKALAYKNITTGVSGKTNPLIIYIVGSLFILVGLVTILTGIGVIFAPLGVYLIFYGRRSLKAYDLVTNYPQT